MSEEINHGLILEEAPKAEDRIFGASKTKKVIIRPSGQWDDDLPEKELQHKKTETNGCVSFSAENCDETYCKARYGKEKNNSDRFTAKMSGTNPNRGNSISAVADSKRNNGSVAESLWPYTDDMDQYQYYSTISEYVKNEGKKYLDLYEVEHDWIYNWVGFSLAQKQKKLIEALPYAPIQVTVKGWTPKNSDGYYTKTSERANHAVMLYGYEEGKYWKIYDHYDNVCKKLEWDYNFSHAKQYIITKKPPLYKTQADGSVDGVAVPKGSIITKFETFRFIFWNKYVGLLFKKLGIKK